MPVLDQCLHFCDGYIFTAPATPTLKTLTCELDFDEKWHKLGVNLGLQEDQLCEIERNYTDNSHRKTEVLRHWLENAKNPSWKAVFDALRQMGEYMVALKIKTKYSIGMCLSLLSTFSQQSLGTRLLVYYT